MAVMIGVHFSNLHIPGEWCLYGAAELGPIVLKKGLHGTSARAARDVPSSVTDPSTSNAPSSIPAARIAAFCERIIISCREVSDRSSLDLIVMRRFTCFGGRNQRHIDGSERTSWG